MSAAWSWQFDSQSATSSSLGPSASASFVSTDPLASLSNRSAATSSDEISWQTFRLSGSKITRKDSKRARLHRFDSDQDDEDDADRTTRLKKEGENMVVAGAAGVESDEDDAVELGDASSEESGISGDEIGEEVESASQVKVEDTTDSSTSVHRKRGRPRHTQVDSSISSVHTIAKAIYKRAEVTSDVPMDPADSTHGDTPTPLTYKETVRLVRLISMIFRFPKSSRRIVRRRSRSDQDHTLSASSTAVHASTSAPITSEASTSTDQSLPSQRSSPRSTSRKPRILAKIHPDDASPNSPAVLKLIALIPAALPARIDCADWIVDLAVEARRDEYGNVFLPNSAYTGVKGDDMDGSAEAERSDSVDMGQGGEETEGVKVTRSVRQRLGREAPSIPLPGFWKRRGEGEKVKVEGADATEIVKKEQEASMDGFDGEGPFTQPTTTVSELDRASQPPSSSPPPSSQHITSSSASSRRTVNLSKALAERMRGKRQAKTLLLRTHQSLRRRKISAGGDAPINAEEDGESQGTAVNDETLRNTIANRRVSGAVVDVDGSEAGEKRDGPKEGLVPGESEALKVKQEEMEVSAP